MTVAQLSDYRPVPPPIGCVHHWRAIDLLCRQLMLSEAAEAQVRCTLAGLILEALAGNAEAIAAWKAIEATIKSPLRQQVSGEQMFEPLLARLREVHSLAAEFWTHHAGGRPCPKYTPTREEWIDAEP
jgi:hypothetical protein